jgi:stage III sporulation protein AC
VEVKMGIDLVFKIAAIGIIVAVLDQVLKNAGRQEIATVTSLAGLVIVLVMIIQQIGSLFTTIKTVFRL